jgi:two-component system response regulator VicR
MVNFDYSRERFMDEINSKLITCIDDDQEMIDLIQLILSRHGFKVNRACGGAAGLALIHREKPELILLDLMMPDMDGWEVYQLIKADVTTKDIPVIIVTAKAQSIDKVLGLHIAKVDDYIAKPFSPKELLDSIESVMARKNSKREI